MDQNAIATLLILSTPLAAVIGAIAISLVRVKGQQRLAEMVQRERLAAIERGLDVSQLAPVPALTGRHAALRKAQGLTIGGLLTFALGAGLALTLLLLPDSEAKTSWPIGLVPLFIGVALLASALVVRRSVTEEP